jgi:uncharacterized protein YhjY with autotransporter beta-barrel domain
MKKLRFQPREIRRAIYNACVALLLLASAQRAATGQSYTAPFQVSGSTVTTSTGTYGTGAGLDEGGANYTSVTIGAGTTINSTNTYAGSFPLEQSLIHASASSFDNAGTLSLNVAGVGGENPALIWLDQGATDLSFTNSGSMNSQVTGGSVTQQEVYLTSTTGSVSFNNTGSIYATASPANFAVVINTNSGNIDINNAQSGTITGNQSGRAIFATASGSGDITFNNAGTMIGGNLGVVLNAGTGFVNATNSGSIEGGDYGFFVQSSGDITLANTSTGVVSGSSSGIYAETVGGNVNISNAGTLTNGAYGYSQSGTVTMLNSGTITGGTSGMIGLGSAVAITNTGTISNSTYGIYAYQSGGTTPAIQVVNSGSITATNSAIYLGTPGTVINSGPLNGGVDAINVPSGSTVILRGNVLKPNTVIVGAIVGGADATSTSRLIFNQNVPPSKYTADRATLDAEIAAYVGQGGGDYTFSFAGLTFDVSNFDFDPGVIDALIGRLYANTPGFYNLGSALDRLNAEDSPPPLLVALNNLPDNAVAGAVAELSPVSLQVFRNVAFDNNTFTNSQINNHLANLRDGQTGFDASQLTVRDAGMDPTLEAVRSRLLAYDPKSAPGLRTDSGPLSDTIDPMIGDAAPRDTKAEDALVAPKQRWSSFIAGDVILADLGGQPTLQSSDYTTGSVTAGLDYRLDEHFTLGALLAYAHTSANLDARGSKATVDSYSPGLYGSYVDGPWYANALASFTRNTYTDDRVNDIPGVAGNDHGAASGSQESFNLTGGREFSRGAFIFGPVASLEYVRLSIGAINEQGPTALEIDKEHQDSFRSLLGVEGRYVTAVATPLGVIVMTPHVSASWQHEYLDDSQGITSQFSGIGGGSFDVQTTMPQRDSAFLDAGLDANINQDVVLFLDYAVEAGQENFFAQSARGGAKIGF